MAYKNPKRDYIAETNRAIATMVQRRKELVLEATNKGLKVEDYVIQQLNQRIKVKN